MSDAAAAAAPASPSGKKPVKVSQLIEERQLPPLDYSFKELKAMSDIIEEEPRSGKRRPRPSQGESKGEVAQLRSSEPAAAKDNVLVQRCYTTSIKLDNNHLTSLAGFSEAIHAVMYTPRRLAWIDLSCNQLTSIDEALTAFEGISVIYLHANAIADIGQVDKLRGLSKLRSLTLHGNPLEETPNYRFYVIAHLPSLRSLDFSPVTPVERDRATSWFSMYGKQLKSSRRRKKAAPEQQPSSPGSPARR